MHFAKSVNLTNSSFTYRFAVGGGVGGLLAGILGVKGSQGEDIVRNGAGQIGEVVGNKM